MVPLVKYQRTGTFSGVRKSLGVSLPDSFHLALVLGHTGLGPRDSACTVIIKLYLGRKKNGKFPDVEVFLTSLPKEFFNKGKNSIDLIFLLFEGKRKRIFLKEENSIDLTF